MPWTIFVEAMREGGWFRLGADGSGGQPDHQRSDDYRCTKVDRPLLVAGSDPPPLLETVDASLHHIAPGVGGFVEARRSSSSLQPLLSLVFALRDNVWDAAFSQELSATRETEAFVGDQPLRALARPSHAQTRHPDGVQQCFELGALVPLARSNEHRQWPPPAVAREVELGS